MLNKKDFQALKKEFDRASATRERAISLSREALLLSKQAIYSAHREDLAEASRLAARLKAKIAEIRKLGYPEPGISEVAVQEYVEAVCFLQFCKSRSIPSYASLGVSPEHYLLGVCDLAGELNRKAVNSAIRGRFEDVYAIKEFVSELYSELLKLDFRNSELRRKFDGVKYELKKLEDLVLELSLKGKNAKQR